MSVPIPLMVISTQQRSAGPQARRLLIMAAIYDGATRSEAAKVGDVGLIIQD
jgi:hypothetical protein